MLNAATGPDSFVHRIYAFPDLRAPSGQVRQCDRRARGAARYHMPHRQRSPDRAALRLRHQRRDRRHPAPRRPPPRQLRAGVPEAARLTGFAAPSHGAGQSCACPAGRGGHRRRARCFGGGALAASLKTGTVAILGGGIDHFTSAPARAAQPRDPDRGLIVSESPTGCKARAGFPPPQPPHHRPRPGHGRGRGGGAVRLAPLCPQGRRTGPRGDDGAGGSPLVPRAAGTNGLIRQGVALVRHAQDAPIDEIVWPRALNLRNARRC